MNTDPRVKSKESDTQPCSLMRRLAAIVYDGLLLIALLMLATLLVILPLQGAITTNNLPFQFYLLVVSWAYFAVCWRGGQSLGMKAWRIHITGSTTAVSWTDTAIRFLVAIFSWAVLGLGFLWSLFHSQRATWHDLASGTRLVVRPRDKSKTSKSR